MAVEGLGRLAAQQPAGAKLPTVRALCGLLSVSLATVVAALERAEAQGIIERRHGSGIYVPPVKPRSVVPLLLGIDASNPMSSDFYRLLIQQARQAAGERGLSVELYSSFSEEWARSGAFGVLAARAERGELLGVIHVIGESVADRLQELGLPWVSVISWPGPGLRVGTDAAAMLKMGMEELSRRGAKRVLVVGNWPGQSVTSPEMIHPAVSRIIEPGTYAEGGQSAEENGYKVGRRLLSQGLLGSGGHDGILITDDMRGRGLLMALGRAGFGPTGAGAGLAVACHSNRGSRALLGFEEDIVRLETDPAEYAAAMLELLIGHGADGGDRLVLMKPRLILPGGA
jgi:DNA-binding transcriptional regulator YhcF (GntR family)